MCWGQRGGRARPCSCVVLASSQSCEVDYSSSSQGAFFLWVGGGECTYVCKKEFRLFSGADALVVRVPAESLKRGSVTSHQEVMRFPRKCGSWFAFFPVWATAGTVL